MNVRDGSECSCHALVAIAGGAGVRLGVWPVREGCVSLCRYGGRLERAFAIGMSSVSVGDRVGRLACTVMCSETGVCQERLGWRSEGVWQVGVGVVGVVGCSCV